MLGLVDAWRFGVPQHRKRLLLLARRDDHAICWPEETATVTNLRDSIGDLPPLNGSIGERELAYVGPSDPSSFSIRMRQQCTPGVLYDHMTRAVRADDLEVFRMMDAKTLYSDIPESLRRYTADSFDDKYKRLDWDDVSRSITAHIAKDGYWYIHPEEHRTLTVREAARIQTFPDSFRFAGTRSDAFRQIGNAVPPLLGEAAARALTPQVFAPDLQTTNWLAARRRLTRWAKTQRKSRYWFMFPGPTVTPPVAVAAAILSNARQDLDHIGEALSCIRGLPFLDAEALENAGKSLNSKAASALGRLRPLLRRNKIWLEPTEVAVAVGLKPAESQIYTLLCDEDVLLTSQGVLRVAARVAGSNSHESNRLTDGRIDLARLVGSGEDSPLRMAALRLLAATRCGVHATACSGCPLADWCRSAQDELTCSA